MISSVSLNILTSTSSPTSTDLPSPFVDERDSLAAHITYLKNNSETLYYKDWKVIENYRDLIQYIEDCSFKDVAAKEEALKATLFERNEFFRRIHRELESRRAEISYFERQLSVMDAESQKVQYLKRPSLEPLALSEPVQTIKSIAERLPFLIPPTRPLVVASSPSVLSVTSQALESRISLLRDELKQLEQSQWETIKGFGSRIEALQDGACSSARNVAIERLVEEREIFIDKAEEEKSGRLATASVLERELKKLCDSSRSEKVQVESFISKKPRIDGATHRKSFYRIKTKRPVVSLHSIASVPRDVQTHQYLDTNFVPFLSTKTKMAVGYLETTGPTSKQVPCPNRKLTNKTIERVRMVDAQLQAQVATNLNVVLAHHGRLLATRKGIHSTNSLSSRSQTSTRSLSSLGTPSTTPPLTRCVSISPKTNENGELLVSESQPIVTGLKPTIVPAF